jgi:NADPH2 dehydrogenase
LQLAKETSLFSPYTIKNVTLKNRVVMSPMCTDSASDQDGKVTDWHITHYASRAVGQVGLIMTEATSVSPEGRNTPFDLGIWDDEQTEVFKRLVDQIHLNGAKAGIQLAHAGRKARLDQIIFAPSPISAPGFKEPKEASIEDIYRLIESFRQAARRAKEAGFDIIEIHAAHGHLINTFLSPLTNHRKDDYGGSERNRYRFLEEVINAVKMEWDGPLFTRISTTEYHPEGNTPQTYVKYAKLMQKQGVDLIDCSSGGVVNVPIDVYPGYQIPAAALIKKEVGIATGAVGLIKTGLQAEEILKNHRADLVFIGKELLRNPYWARTAAIELNVTIPYPKPYQIYGSNWFPGN